MTNPTTTSDVGERRGQLLRNAVGVLLDGVLPPDDAHAIAAWRAVESAQAEAPTLARLLGEAEAGVVASRCDRVHTVLRALIPEVQCVSNWDAAFHPRGVAFLPCPGLRTFVHPERVYELLDAGGVVVSSDRALEFEPLRSLVPAAGRSGPRRARVDCGPVLPDMPLLPAVELSAGHVSLDAALVGRAGVQLLAVDALSDEPLIVLVPAGNGWVLHAVPHWFQQDAGWFTALERGCVADAPWARDRWRSVGHVRIGDLLAALAMAMVLRRGLAIARGDRGFHEDARVGGDERIAADA